MTDDDVLVFMIFIVAVSVVLPVTPDGKKVLQLYQRHKRLLFCFCVVFMLSPEELKSSNNMQCSFLFFICRVSIVIYELVLTLNVQLAFVWMLNDCERVEREEQNRIEQRHREQKQRQQRQREQKQRQQQREQKQREERQREQREREQKQREQKQREERQKEQRERDRVSPHEIR